MDLTATVEGYTKLLQQWNNIILFACILGFWLSLALHHFHHSDETPDEAPTRKFWFMVFAIAYLLRLPLTIANPWYDETYTYLMATVDWSAFPSALLSDVHPPGFYMLGRLMVGIFGNDIYALRLPSMVAGLALPWVVYRYGYLMSGSHTTGKLAAVIVAILPRVAYYSTDARYPMLLAVVILLAMIAILEDKPHRFAILAALPVYLHSMGIFYAGMLAIGALVYRPSRQWLSAAAFAGVLGGLWLPGILIQSQIVGNGFWLQLEYPITYIVDMTTGREGNIYVLFSLWVLLFALSFRVLRFEWNRRMLLWALVAVGVPAIAWLVSALWQPIYLPRALLASTLLFVPIWAHELKRFGVLLIIPLGLLVFPLYTLHKTDRAPIAQVFALCEDASNVYALNNSMAIPSLYYLPDTPVTVWRASNTVDITTELTPQIQAAFNIAIADNPHELENVCIVARHGPHTTQSENDELNRLTTYPGSHVQVVDAHRLYKWIVIRYPDE